MHVGFVVANYPPHVGGVQHHVASLAAELLARGHQVTVFNAEPPGRRTHRAVPVVGLGRHAAVGDIAAFPSPRKAVQLPRMLAAEGVDVVSVHTRFFPATWLGLLAAHRRALPVVLTEHGSGHAQVASPLIRSAVWTIDKTVATWAWRSADLVLAVSQKAADFVWAGSGRHAEVCANGIDVDWWSQGAGQGSDRRLLFVGRVVPEKGWRSFLAVASAMPHDVTFEVLGDGPDLASLRAEAVYAGVSGRISVLGHLPSEQVRQHLRGAVLVNPSVAAEGLQTTLLEAAAAGARVVTYDVGGAAELAASAARVWVVPAGDLDGLTEATHESLGSSWRPPPRLHDFSWDRVGSRYEEAFERAIAMRPGR